MAWYADLTPCDYFGDQLTPVLRSIGWLEQGYDFPTGVVDPEVFFRLVELRRDPWQPVVATGIHECTLCQYGAEAHGANNVFIPGDGTIYVCPELITHYMNAHRYAPPAVFCDSVLACPPMRSVEYMKLLLANGGRMLVKPRS